MSWKPSWGQAHAVRRGAAILHQRRDGAIRVMNNLQGAKKSPEARERSGAVEVFVRRLLADLVFCGVRSGDAAIQGVVLVGGDTLRLGAVGECADHFAIRGSAL